MPYQGDSRNDNYKFQGLLSTSDNKILSLSLLGKRKKKTATPNKINKKQTNDNNSMYSGAPQVGSNAF